MNDVPPPMNDVPPPTRLTSRALTVGSLAAAALLGMGLVLDMAGQSAIGKLVGDIGVVVLLVTPGAGLVATWWELRSLRPTYAWLSVAVLVVLVLATIVSTAARI